MPIRKEQYDYCECIKRILAIVLAIAMIVLVILIVTKVALDRLDFDRVRFDTLKEAHRMRFFKMVLGGYLNSTTTITP